MVIGIYPVQGGEDARFGGSIRVTAEIVGKLICLGMTYDEFSGLALAMPDVRENVRRTESDLFRGDRHLSRFRVKPSVLAVRVPWDVYDRLSALHPEVFIDFPHYHGTSYLCASPPNLDPDLAQKLLDEAWEAANEVIGPRG